MIRLISGVYGAEDGLKRPKDGPFSLTDNEEARLVSRGVAEYVFDRTTLPADLWARESEDSLTGLFLREMRRRLDGADEGERDKLLLCARFGLAALEGGEDVRP